MSVENVKKFFEDVAKEEKLKKKVQELQSQISDREISKTGTPEEAINMIISIAEKFGYNFSEDELKEYVSKMELSDDMLTTVSGGSGPTGPTDSLDLGFRILVAIATFGASEVEMWKYWNDPNNPYNPDSALNKCKKR